MITLSEEVINKIAAGEVIEKPSCIIRELLDNSLDAGAKNITIKVDFNDLNIRVEDDGTGIENKYVALAFKRHTTSKIKSLEEIYHLKSRGFRGEALAAIASISQVMIKTKVAHSDTGTHLVLKGGEIIKKESLALTLGTKIEIKNLFYNTPVRKKFISYIGNDQVQKIKPGEKKAIKEEIIFHALASTGVSFKYYISNKKGVYQEEIFIPPSLTLKDKILLFYSPSKTKKIAEHLLEIDSEFSRFKIKGFISDLSLKERTSQKQFLIIGGRVIRDYRFLKAVQTAYLNKLPWGTHPWAFIKLSPPPQEVDINVHPQKKEVRFKDKSLFFRVIYQEVKNELDKKIFSKQRKDLSSSNLYEQKILPPNLVLEDLEGETDPRKKYLSGEKKLEFVSPFSPPISFRVLGQIAKCYILFVVENNLYITDQHAAHERINFDKVMEIFKSEQKSTDNQILLIPLAFEITVLEKDAILNQQDWLKKLNFEVDDFGEKTLRLTSYPAYIKENKINSVMEEIFNALVEKEELNSEDFLKDIAARMACRMSVMKGDLLSLAEMESIIKEIYEKDYIHACPHGRPFVKKISERELDNFFDRNKHIR